ncbi:unnamed protein product [Protopolystoma xenopodis]|uniref:Uncharacterized protein n=1 Tax=Protopolystoma xenopodis TaxID=117903 RepID=A0A448WCW2_9PLAT|nr:unnamed protein product [Protopolystoma xenopodis]
MGPESLHVATLPVCYDSLQHTAVYCIANTRLTEMVESLKMYDPDLDQWTPIAPMRFRRIGLGVAVLNR